MALMNWIRSRELLHSRLNAALTEAHHARCKAAETDGILRQSCDEWKKAAEMWEARNAIKDKLITHLGDELLGANRSCRSYKAANTKYREVIGVLRNMLKGKIADREQIKILTDHIAVQTRVELEDTEDAHAV